MMGDILNNCLTIYPVVDNLAQLSHRAIAIGIGVPKSTFQKYSKSKHKSIMSGCLEGLTTASPLSLYANSLRSDTIELAFLLSGLIHFQRKPAMSQDDSNQNYPHAQIEQAATKLLEFKVFRDSTQAIQTILETDEEIGNFPDDHLHKLIKYLGDYQDHCHLMVHLADESIVRIESILNNRIGGL